MLTTLKMALARCLIGFPVVIIAVLQMKKSQIDTENDKNPKIAMLKRVKKERKCCPVC